MMSFPPLPFPPHTSSDETAQHYGQRLLKFVIETRITSTMSDEQLQMAAYVVPIAMWNRGTEGTDLLVVEQIRTAAALITATLTARVKMVEEDAAATRPAAGGQSAAGGSPVPLHPSPSIGPQPPVTHVELTAEDFLEELPTKVKDYRSLAAQRPKVDINF